MKLLQAALLALLMALPAAAQAPAPRFDGIWDLTWQTRHGPQQRGYFVLRRQGDRLDGEIHGQGSVRASGTVNGSAFLLHGSRMLVPYRIEGRVRGDRMEGELRILSVDRRFTGIRRP